MQIKIHLNNTLAFDQETTTYGITVSYSEENQQKTKVIEDLTVRKEYVEEFIQMLRRNEFEINNLDELVDDFLVTYY